MTTNNGVCCTYVSDGRVISIRQPGAPSATSRSRRDKAEISGKCQHGAPLKLAAKHDVPVPIEAMNLKHRLSDIEASRRNDGSSALQRSNA
jgi:hypothetical protein